ncbi:MAG TPA: hypothetical protein VIL85_14070 [Thermomicrobiales bacterium]|jgi:hypothetical protein
MRAIVAGMIGTYPLGGVAWDYGQYALGLARLGFEVYYLEDAGLPTYNPPERDYGEDPSYSLRFLQESLASISPTLTNRWHFRAMDGETYGLDRAVFRDIAADADLFLNVSGGCLLRDEYLPCRRKVLIDTDPGWNHFVQYPRWDAMPLAERRQGFRSHDHFFTYAQRIGQPDCLLPTYGIAWQPTRPPVVPDCWSPEPPGSTWTTVMTWDNYGRPIGHDGAMYGSKELEFPRIEDVPRSTTAALEIAVGGSSAPRARWRALGWGVVDPTAMSTTPDAYRSYIQRSRGEFSVAKNIYVATRSGWFSCRSACYLAAGRPVVVQDTGFSASLPVGDGLLAFSSRQEAVAGLAAVEAGYRRHQQAARDIAHEYFDAGVVLADLLTRVGMG